MTVNYLTGEKDCILKIAMVKSIFRNTIILDYNERTYTPTLFYLKDDKEYLGESDEGDLVFDK